MGEGVDAANEQNSNDVFHELIINKLLAGRIQLKYLKMRLVTKQMFSFANIGFIGLGNMGMPMAINLAKKGHKVFGYDVDSTKSQEAEKHQISFRDTISKVATEAEIFVTMLPNSSHSVEVCQSEGGLFKNAKANSLIIDSSTISPLAARSLNEKGKDYSMTYVDAPVSGGVTGAVNGTLTFMVGSESEAVFNRCKPVLEGMGKNFFNCQKASGGQIVKLSNNMSLAIQMIGIAESLAMAERLGMDPKEVANILSVSTARCWSVDTYCPVPGHIPTAPSSRNYEHGFGTDLMLKDLRLAIEAAEESETKVTMGKNSLKIYEQLSARGFGKKDFSIIFDLIKKNQA